MDATVRALDDPKMVQQLKSSGTLTLHPIQPSTPELIYGSTMAFWGKETRLTAAVKRLNEASLASRDLQIEVPFPMNWVLNEDSENPVVVSCVAAGRPLWFRPLAFFADGGRNSSVRERECEKDKKACRRERKGDQLVKSGFKWFAEPGLEPESIAPDRLMNRPGIRKAMWLD